MIKGVYMKPILIVEDEAYLRELYADEFVEAGFEVRMVSTGKEAIEYVMADRPELVVLDIMLPDMNGLGVLEKIKIHDKTIPVILNSAYSVYRTDFLSWMADDYVVKSSNISELVARVGKYLGHNRPRQSLAAG
jgi:DNA-binding response OmpR family regulator